MGWLHELYRQDDGGLTFEWVLLVTLVVIGIAGGLTAARDAALSELGDVAGAIVAVDQSYTGFGTSWTDEPADVVVSRPDPGGGP